MNAKPMESAIRNSYDVWYYVYAALRATGDSPSHPTPYRPLPCAIHARYNTSNISAFVLSVAPIFRLFVPSYRTVEVDTIHPAFGIS
jgi:hypothetical protein